VKINWYTKKLSQSSPPESKPSSSSSGHAGERSTDGEHLPMVHRTWMDDIVAEHQQDGGFDSLKNKGKPLDLGTDNSYDAILNRTLKEANVRPQWLQLQHEIYDELRLLLKTIKNDPEADVDLKQVQAKVRMYNATCPHPSLQKPSPTRENIARITSFYAADADDE
jgi:hypothetical protein